MNGPARSALDVVVVGSLNRDYVCRMDRLPVPGQTVLGGEATVGSGGKGGNQAAAAARLGASTAMVGHIGDDDDGRALLSDLHAVGVDTAEVSVLHGVRTGLAFVLVDSAGTNAIVVAPGANNRLGGDSVRRSLRRLLTPPGVLVIQAEIPEDSFEAALTTAEQAGCRAVVNLAPYRPLSDALFPLCDPLVLNESEAGDLLGRPVTGAAEARTAVDALRARVPSVVVTAGAEGAVVADQSGIHQVATEEVTSVDTTGAGDAFTGAVAAALASGTDLVEAVRIGVRAGTYAVTRAGAQASFPDGRTLGLEPLTAHR